MIKKSLEAGDKHILLSDSFQGKEKSLLNHDNLI